MWSKRSLIMPLIAIVTLSMVIIYNMLMVSESRADTNFNYPSFETNKKLNAYTYEDVECLAKNIFFEAGTESMSGKLAVGLVTMNRVKHSKFPNEICSVIYEGPTSKWHRENTGKEVPIRNKCQFSWYCDGKSDDISTRSRMSANFQQSLDAAYKVLSGNYDGMVEGATHYHADYVDPYWRHHLTYITKIDRHKFYRLDTKNPA